MIVTGGARTWGQPCFCAGADIKEPGALGGYRPGFVGGVAAFTRSAKPPDGFLGLLERIESFRGITIAAIDGICTGGGLGLALACDIRILSTTADIRDVHVPVQGRIGHAVTARLARCVGPAWAKELLLTGEKWPVAIAVQAGFARAVVQSEDLLEQATMVARQLAARTVDQVELVKNVVDYAVDASRQDGSRFAYLAWASCGGGSGGLTDPGTVP